jgi:hypothetical protein
MSFTNMQKKNLKGAREWVPTSYLTIRKLLVQRSMNMKAEVRWCTM